MKRILCLLFILFSISCNENHHNKPNILFISIDDMNDWTTPLGGNNQVITPNL